jgi:hypothetical protein
MKIEAKLSQSVHPQSSNHGRTIRGSHWKIAKHLLLFLLLLPLLAQGHACFAQASPQTTMAIFNERPMPDGLWHALIATLRQDLAPNSPEVQGISAQAPSQSKEHTSGTVANPQIEVIRGDKIEPGIAVDNSVTVYLMGDCKTTPTPQSGLSGQPQPRISGALGWVNMTDAHIEPFIHVDCKRIGQMLGVAGIGRSSEERNQLMANAISRVVLHEWIHIATQNPKHSREGVTKAKFGVQDLLAQPAQPVGLKGTGWQIPDQESGARLVQSPAPNQASQSRVRATR